MSGMSWESVGICRQGLWELCRRSPSVVTERDRSHIPSLVGHRHPSLSMTCGTVPSIRRGGASISVNSMHTQTVFQPTLVHLTMVEPSSRLALRTSLVLQMSSFDSVGNTTSALAGPPSKSVSLCIPMVREFDMKQNDRI